MEIWPKSSGLAQTAAALMQFGLLSPKGAFSARHFGLTLASLELMRTSPWHVKMKRLIRKAAVMPKIHRELFLKFGGAGKVDDAAIEHYLVVDRALADDAAFSAYFRPSSD